MNFFVAFFFAPTFFTFTFNVRASEGEEHEIHLLGDEKNQQD